MTIDRAEGRPATAAPPVPQLEAGLALAVLARRAAARTRRHLLERMPLLGRSGRRLARMRAGGDATDPMAWRAVTPVAAPERRAAPGSHSSLGQSEPRMAPESPGTGRDAGLAPALVWFARWRELRTVRTMRERQVLPALGLRPLRPQSSAAMTRRHHPSARTEPAPRQPSPGIPPARDARTALAAARPAGAAAYVADAPPNMLHAPLPHAVTPRTEADAGIAAASPPLRHAELHEETTQGHARAAVPTGPTFTWSLASTLGHPDASRAAPAAFATGVAAAPGSCPTFTDLASRASAAALPPLVASRAPAARAAAYAREAVTELLSARVSAAVHDAVERAIARVETARRAQAADAPPPPATRVADIDDHTAGLLLGRMRALLREERFRHGQLR